MDQKISPKGLQKWFKIQCQSQVTGRRLWSTKNKKVEKDLMRIICKGMKQGLPKTIKILCYGDKIEILE